MNRLGPIIVVEDDIDDQFLFKTAFQNLNCPNEILFFSDAIKALEFLNTSESIPFLIMSDLKLPKINGLEFREHIRTIEKLELKCLPFILFSSTAYKQIVVDAYAQSVQGFFTKKNLFEEFQQNLKTIIEYWHASLSPNQF